MIGLRSGKFGGQLFLFVLSVVVPPLDHMHQCVLSDAGLLLLRLWLTIDGKWISIPMHTHTHTHTSQEVQSIRSSLGFIALLTLYHDKESNQHPLTEITLQTCFFGDVPTLHTSALIMSASLPPRFGGLNDVADWCRGTRAGFICSASVVQTAGRAPSSSSSLPRAAVPAS